MLDILKSMEIIVSRVQRYRMVFGSKEKAARDL